MIPAVREISAKKSYNKLDPRAVSQVQAQGASILTSQEWRHHPTTYGPGSWYEIARTQRRTIHSEEPVVHAEEETCSNASTLVVETRFDPIWTGWFRRCSRNPWRRVSLPPHALSPLYASSIGTSP